MKKIKVGVIGCGFIHNVYHMPAFQRITEVEVVAACAATRQEVQPFADRWHIAKQHYGDDGIERLCADPEIDVVDIGLPNFLHLPAARAAAENHKHVICEKPLGRNVREARQMLAIVRRYGVIHCYAENQIFMPQVVKAKEFINKGALGKVFWVRSREAHFGPHSKWFWDPKLAGGGVLMDMGCHSIEVARYLIGRRPVSTCAWVSTFVHDTRAEENSVVMVKHEGSELAQAENSWAAHGGFDLRIETYGSDGTIFIDATKGTGLQMFTVAAEKKIGEIVEKAETKKGWMFPTWNEVEAYGFPNELGHFISCMGAGKQPSERFEDGLLVNKIVDAAYRSVKSRRWENV
jgi:predicted dehydrogenase